MMIRFFALLMSIFVFLNFAHAQEYKACSSELVQNWLVDTRIPIADFAVFYFGATVKKTHTKYYRMFYSIPCYDEYEPNCYCTGEGSDRECTEYITDRTTRTRSFDRTAQKNTLEVSGQNETGTADLSFSYQGEYFEVIKSRFGSGEIESDFMCCFPEKEITVHDNTSGFQHSFPTGKYNCAQKQKDMTEASEAEGMKVRFVKDTKTLCESFNRPIRRWKTSRKISCPFRDEDEPLGYSCDKVIETKRFLGCKSSSDTGNSDFTWDYNQESGAEVINKYDQSVQLFCDKSSIKLRLKLSQRDRRFLKQIVGAEGDIELNAQTNRSQTYYLGKDNKVDLEKLYVSVSTKMEESFLKSLRVDKSFELSLTKGELAKTFKFGLKGSGKSIKRLQRDCK